MSVCGARVLATFLGLCLPRSIVFHSVLCMLRVLGFEVRFGIPGVVSLDLGRSLYVRVQCWCVACV
jgi:hypothetical protein